MGVRGIKDIVRLMPKIEKEIIDKVYFKVRSPIIEISKIIIKNRLKEHPTYIKIASNQYNQHFGFHPETGESRVAGIVLYIIETLNIRLEKTGRTIQIIAILDNESLYQLKEAIVINNSKNARLGKTDKELPWLKWILESGGHVTVGYGINIRDYSGSPDSRSQEALMKPHYGPDWSVPQDIQGTDENNWILKSFKDAEDKLTLSVRQIITKAIKEVKI